MTFALLIWLQYTLMPAILHGYIDKAECERAATFITATAPATNHSCIPEHYSPKE
jgi:hypothetical protein